MRTFLLVATITFSLLWGKAVFASESARTICLGADVLISEIDYDQPGTDNLEFVELFGRPNASLTRYELRFIDSSGTIYNTISLTGHSITSSGYFVIGNDDLFNDPQITLSNNSISNNKASVGLFDKDDDTYCNAINYEGTVSGFSDWFNIGSDSEAHGEGRGCARAASGWWSCNRPTTPSGSNGVVAVQLRQHSSAEAGQIGMLLLVISSMALSTRLVWNANSAKR